MPKMHLKCTSMHLKCTSMHFCQMFMRANGLSLILRSHEGPDARAAAVEEAMSLELVEDGIEGDIEGAAEDDDKVGPEEGSGLPATTVGPAQQQGPTEQPPVVGSASPQGPAAAALKAAQELLAQIRAAAVAQCMALMQDGFTEDHVTPCTCQCLPLHRYRFPHTELLHTPTHSSTTTRPPQVASSTPSFPQPPTLNLSPTGRSGWKTAARWRCSAPPHTTPPTL